jgi:hypothetical protein
MTTWILILVVWFTEGTAITQVPDFATAADCEAARAEVSRQTPNFAFSGNRMGYAYCIKRPGGAQTGGEPK